MTAGAPAAVGKEGKIGAKPLSALRTGGGSDATAVGKGPGLPKDTGVNGPELSASLRYDTDKNGEISKEEARAAIKKDYPAWARDLASQSSQAGNTKAADAFDASARAVEEGDFQKAAELHESGSGMLALSGSNSKTKNSALEEQRKIILVKLKEAEIIKEAARWKNLLGLATAGIQIAFLL